MIEFVEAPDHVIAFRVSGKLTGEEFDRITADVDAKLGRHRRLTVYADLVEFSDMTGEAIAKDLRYDLLHLPRFRRFARCAVVTDKEWLQALARFVSRWIASLDLRTFAPAERDQALAWASAPVEGRTTGPALRTIETARPGVYAFEWDGKANAEEMAAVVSELRAAFAVHDKVRLVGRIKRLGGVAPQALLSSGLLSLKLEAFRKVERYALVGGPSWLGGYADRIRSLFGIDVRHFDFEHESDAWAWIEAPPPAGL